MDSSTSAESPEPRVAELATIAEQTAAIDQLIALARHHIQVFDQDLSQTGWNGAARTERLATFLRGVRGRRLDIIVHDTRYLESACPRMLKLLSVYGYAMAILQTGAEGKVATDPLLIIDGSASCNRSKRSRWWHDSPKSGRPASLASTQPFWACRLASDMHRLRRP